MPLWRVTLAPGKGATPRLLFSLGKEQGERSFFLAGWCGVGFAPDLGGRGSWRERSDWISFGGPCWAGRTSPLTLRMCTLI